MTGKGHKNTIQYIVMYSIKVNVWHSGQKLYKYKYNTTHNKTKTQTNNAVTVNQEVERGFVCS